MMYLIACSGIIQNYDDVDKGCWFLLRRSLSTQPIKMGSIELHSITYKAETNKDSQQRCTSFASWTRNR